MNIALSAFSETADSDGDGIPDATEARLGGDPLDSGLPDGVPQVSVESGVRYFAYSGIRQYQRNADDLRSHLGLTPTTDSATIASAVAYYLSSDPNASCRDGSQFPASFAAPVAMGGCEPVDFLNMPAGVERKIGWVVMGTGAAAGYWATDLSTASNLPEQTVYRVPEINMLSQRLFFSSSADDTATVDVVADHDGSTVSGLMLTVSTASGTIEASVTGVRFALSVSQSGRRHVASGIFDHGFVRWRQ